MSIKCVINEIEKPFSALSRDQIFLIPPLQSFGWNILSYLEISGLRMERHLYIHN